MITIKYRGRFGNNLIQYAAAVILAKKHGLKLETKPYSRYSNRGIYKTTSSNKNYIEINFGPTFNLQEIDGKIYENVIELNDKNFLKYLKEHNEQQGFLLNGFFQTSELLCDYREDILELYKPPETDFKPNKNDAFIACRLGDCLVTKRKYCSIEYIENQIKKNISSYDNVYITSDTIDHPQLQNIIKRYGLIICEKPIVDKMLFASKFNNLILSAGSFSYWMAYFSKAENITVYKCNNHDPIQKNNAWSYNNNIKFES